MTEENSIALADWRPNSGSLTGSVPVSGAVGIGSGIRIG